MSQSDNQMTQNVNHTLQTDVQMSQISVQAYRSDVLVSIPTTFFLSH
jgi:hypothetical protein